MAKLLQNQVDDCDDEVGDKPSSSVVQDDPTMILYQCSFPQKV